MDPAAGQAVDLRLTVLGVDFEVLSGSVGLMRSFEDACRASIAREAGVDEDDVDVLLSAGSVLVTSTISVPAGSSGSVVAGSLQSEALASSVASSVAAVEGIAAASEGDNIAVASVTAVVAAVSTTSAASSTATGEVLGESGFLESVLNMFPGGSVGLGVSVAAGVCCVLSTFTACNIIRRKSRRRKGVWGNEVPAHPPRRALDEDDEDDQCEDVAVDLDDYLCAERSRRGFRGAVQRDESQDPSIASKSSRASAGTTSRAGLVEDRA